MTTPYKIRCFPEQRKAWQAAAAEAGIDDTKWATAALDQAASGRLKVKFDEPTVEVGWNAHGAPSMLVVYYIRRSDEQLDDWTAASAKVGMFASKTGGTNVSEWCRQVLDYAATLRATAEVVFSRK